MVEREREDSLEGTICKRGHKKTLLKIKSGRFGKAFLFYFILWASLFGGLYTLMVMDWWW